MHFFLFAVLLASSAFAADDLCFCSQEYKPVCGYNGKTYSNACKARCDGADIKKYGECDCICTEEYDPVCGADGKTYGNACKARCRGVEIKEYGECSCYCTEEYMPVCGYDGKTYSNACKASCKGVEVKKYGECSSSCPPKDTFCPQVIVCGSDGKEYSTPCAADCAGVKYEPANGKCPLLCDLDRLCKYDQKDYADCSCPSIEICGKDGKTYSGPCEALCAGLKPGDWYEGACEEIKKTCSCSFKYPWEKGTQEECYKKCGYTSVYANVEVY